MRFGRIPMTELGNSKEGRTATISLVIVLGFISSIAYHAAQCICLQKGYPYNTFLFRPEDRFMDFFNSYRHVSDRMPYLPGDLERVHLPFTQLMHFLLTALPPGISHVVFVCCFALFTSFYCFKFIRETSTTKAIANTLIFTWLTYPFLIELDRSHIEAVTFLYLALFVASVQRSKSKQSIASLAAAVAMKPYLMVFYTFWLADKKYKSIAHSALAAIGLTVLSLLIFRGGMVDNLTTMASNIQINKESYTIGHEGMYFGHSMFGAIKVVLIYLFGSPAAIGLIQSYHLMTLYFLLAAASFLFISIYVVKFEECFWKKIALLCFSMLVLPYNSPDVRLINLYVPLLLFINTKKESRFNFQYAILFGLLMIPKDYWHYAPAQDMSSLTYIPPIPEITSSVFLQPTLMAAFAALIVFDRISRTRATSAGNGNNGLVAN